MTEKDIVSLGLKPKDISPTTVVDLAGQMGAYVTYPDPQIFTLRIRPLDKTQSDCRADYGCRIYYGILPHGGATVEQAVGAGHYLI